MRVQQCASVGLAAMVLAAGGGSAGDCEPVLVGALDVPIQSPIDIRVADGLASICGFNHVTFVDVTSPGQPVLLTSMAVDSAYASDLASQRAYVVGTLGLRVISVSDPQTPDLISSIDVGFCQWRSVRAVGSKLYIPDGHADLPFLPPQGGLLFVDVADAQHPFISGLAITPGLAAGVVLDGPIAYVADGWAGVEAVDVSVGSMPAVVGRFDPVAPIPGGVAWLDRTGDVLVACEVDRLVVADVTTPGSMFPRGEIMLGQPRHVQCTGDTAVATFGVGDGTRQVALVDVANPSSPSLRLAFEPVGGVEAIFLDGNRLYATNPTRGLVIYDLPGCIGTMACSLADVAEPRGVLDIDDVLTFLQAFAAGDPLADVAPPPGVLDIDDVLTFLSSFASGCP